MGVRIKASKARKKLSQTSDAVDSGSSRGTQKIAEELADMIRTDAPVDTGALRRSVDVVGDRVVVGGGAVDYAPYVERREHFVAHNVAMMKAKAANIVDDEVRRRLP